MRKTIVPLQEAEHLIVDSPEESTIRRLGAAQQVSYLMGHPSMSDSHKEILDLRYRQGLSYDQVGKIIGRTREAVRLSEAKAIHRANTLLTRQE